MLSVLRAGFASSVGRRLIGGTIANFLDKLAVLAVQLVAIPLLSHHWGAEGYGTWLMLMTIPTFVAVSDFGLGTAAGVEITQRVARGDTAGALETFQSAWMFVATIALAVVLLAATYSTFVLSGAIPGAADLAIAVLLVTLYAIAAVQMTALAIVYRATHKFAHAMLISALVVFAEGIVLVAVVSLGGRLVELAASLLLVRALGCTGTYAVLRRLEPWLRLGVGSARIGTVWRLAPHSTAALALTLASGFSLQGIVLVLGWTAGPSIAATFGAARFIARIPLQFSGLLVRASIPELTRAQADSDNEMVARLTRLNVSSALAPTLPLVPILALLGPQLLLAMSGSELSADWWLFALLSSATMLNAFWQAAASPMQAANKQARYAYLYLALSVVLVGVAALPTLPPLMVAGVATLLIELVISATVIKLARKAHHARTR